MTGDEGEGPRLLGEQLPIEPLGIDELPLSEVRIGSRPDGANGETYWYFVLPGGRQSAVGYLDPDVAVRKGAETLRAERQKQAMRQG